MQLGSMFICNRNIALQSYTQYDLVRMPSTLEGLLDTSPRLMPLTRGCYYSF